MAVLKNLVLSVEACDFDCTGGPLAMNIHWQMLKGLLGVSQNQETPLASAYQSVAAIEAVIADNADRYKASSEALRQSLLEAKTKVSLASQGLDPDKIELAKTVLSICGTYKEAGSDRASVISDAIKQLSTGVGLDGAYTGLWKHALCTKSYDRWHGQRSDHPYGYGPRHGSIIFSVGLTKQAREKTFSDIPPASIEAALYYLTNIEAIEAAKEMAVTA